MSKAPEFVRTNKPLRRDEGIFEYNDPVFCRIALSEAETDKAVIRAAEYRGFIVKLRGPHMHWIVFAALDGSEIPLALQGHFSSQRNLIIAIDKHIEAEKRKSA